MAEGQRLGLMGGTFDPLHYGHLIIAEESRRLLELDEVLFIPAGHPPHKDDRQVTDPEHRFAMTLVGIAGDPCFRASRVEVERDGPSFAVDTVAQVRAERPEAELFFITGADAILEILTWRRHAELIHMCQFVAATRPGYDMSRLEGALPSEYLARITPLTVPGIDISSSMIRARVALGQSIRYLAPEPVVVYIQQNRLYQQG